MKLHILSDLHLEFGKWPKSVDVNAIDADVTILAGDIGVGLQGIQWALTIDRPVIYVMGNHEFYGQRPMEYLWRKAREKVAGTNIHLLENESVLIDDPENPSNRLRFLGTTLWTDFCALGPDHQEACMEEMGRLMTDYRSIFVSRRGSSIPEPGFTTRRQGDQLKPKDTLAFHQQSREYLERELGGSPDSSDIQEAWNKTVVISHHAPSVRSLVSQKAMIQEDSAYASHLDALVTQADLWIHGHTHVQVDYRLGSSTGRVISNPRGYIGHTVVRDFNPTLTVEV